MILWRYDCRISTETLRPLLLKNTFTGTEFPFEGITLRILFKAFIAEIGIANPCDNRDLSTFLLKRYTIIPDLSLTNIRIQQFHNSRVARVFIHKDIITN